MIITKKHLPRRTVLRGLGASLALPLLDSMVPAFTALGASAAKPIKRLGIVYVPNGVFMSGWTPEGDSEILHMTTTLQPLAPFRERMVVLSGLSNKQGDPLPGEGAGDHARASGAYLTGVHPKKTEGADIRAGVSMDQIAAQALGQETQLASLELCLESEDRAGSCDPGYSCVYANTLCWRGPTTPISMVNDPRVVFERLFGTSGSTDPAAWLAGRREDRSLLDGVTGKLARLQRELGPRDQGKLNEYLDSVRDVERRIQKAERQTIRELPAMNQPVGVPADFAEHASVMFDLQVLAYQADLTRVITFMVGHETSARAYPEIGVPDAHHALSHHGNNTEMIAKLIKIDGYNTRTFATYLAKLAATPDGDGSLLDHVTLLYGSGMSDGNSHNHHNLPTLLVGGGLKGGRHLRYPNGTPVTNLFMTMLQKVGVPSESIGDSTGAVQHLSDV